MRIKESKGFTIIELIVVIAIIAVLAAIVMVNVTSYIAKGKDAAIRGNLSSTIGNATVYFDANVTYTNFCASPGATLPLASADDAFDGNGTPDEVTDCNAIATAWAACGQLRVSDAYFCVDSTGAKKTIATRATCLTAWAATACP